MSGIQLEQLPFIQRPEAARRTWHEQEELILLEEYAKVEPSFSKKDYKKDGTVKVMSSKEALELWAKLKEDVSARIPHIRGVFKGDNPVKAKIEWLKSADKKLLETQKAIEAGRDELRDNPVHTKLDSICGSDPLVNPSVFLDSHTAPDAPTFGISPCVVFHMTPFLLVETFHLQSPPVLQMP